MTLKGINETRHFKDEMLTRGEDFLRTRRYSQRTISTYLYWIKLFILFNGKQHPTVLRDEHIVRFLTFLATERNVSAGTQALALNAVVFVINGEGGRYSLVTLADELLPALREQIGQVERFVRRDRSTDQYAGVWLPDALARKYSNAPFDLGWHYLFPASRLSVDPAGGCLRRHHFDENNLNW